LKNGAFWNVTPCGSCKNRGSEKLSASIIRVTRIGEPILVTLMMEALSFSETSVLTRAIRRNIPEHGILHSYPRKTLKSYIALTDWTLSGDVMCPL
jgi:hypothetical protein